MEWLTHSNSLLKHTRTYITIIAFTIVWHNKWKGINKLNTAIVSSLFPCSYIHAPKNTHIYTHREKHAHTHTPTQTHHRPIMAAHLIEKRTIRTCWVYKPGLLSGQGLITGCYSGMFHLFIFWISRFPLYTTSFLFLSHPNSLPLPSLSPNFPAFSNVILKWL